MKNFHLITKLSAAFTVLFFVTVGPIATHAAETFEIDKNKSKVTFKINNKPPGQDSYQEVPGTFSDFDGTVVFDDENPSASSVELTVKTTSVDTGNKKRDDHLRNQDFFKVKEFPTMSFKSTGVKKADDGTYEVTGKFTLLGKSREVSVTFKPSGENGGTTTFTIKRSDYGMDYRVPDTADEVIVTLDISGKSE